MQGINDSCIFVYHDIYNREIESYKQVDLRGVRIMNIPSVKSKLSMQLPDLLHCFRVASLSLELCDKLGICGKIREGVYIAAILHDIGKAMINIDTLNKEGPLNSEEWREIKYHAELGGIIASNMGHSPEVIKSIIHHHENFDGSGYPRKIKGNKISLGAQIIRICDSYDALRMERPYKRSLTHEAAIEKIMQEKEKYNQMFLHAFLSLDFSKIKGIKTDDFKI